MKKIIILMLAVTLAVGLASCKGETTTLSESTFALDTIVQIKLYYQREKDKQPELIDEAFQLIRDLEDTLSVHVDGSELHNIKQDAGKSITSVSDITYDIILDSVKYSDLTDGLFDVSAGPLIDLWAIDPPDGYVPTESELSDVLQLVDYRQIDLSTKNQVYLEQEDMIINLGAIAKGAIADEVKKFLVEKGVTSCFINLGGNVLLIGNKPGGVDFSVGVQNPFDDRGAYLMAVDANDVAFVSSGDYERFFEQDGEIYHHILDAKTGYPSDTNIKQVSIIAPSSQMADALSTSVLLLGIEDGLKLTESIGDIEVIIVTKDKRIYITEALRDKVTYSEEQMDGFTVVEDVSELYD